MLNAVRDVKGKDVAKEVLERMDYGVDIYFAGTTEAVQSRGGKVEIRNEEGKWDAMGLLGEISTDLFLLNLKQNQLVNGQVCCR